MTAEVLAVILNWRDADATRACLASVLADPAIAGVVLVDNESSGDLRDLRAAGVDLLELTDNEGFSRGVNAGVRRALERGAAAVLIINNDAVLEEGAASTLSARWQLGDAGFGLVAPIILNEDHTVQSTGGRLSRRTAATSDLASSEPDYLTWACVLIPRDTFDRVGLLDEGFFLYWEDVDFGLRVNDVGLKLVVEPQASVIHQRSRSHARAGAAIDQYGAHGLVLLARKRRDGALWLGAVIRLAARVIRRASAGRWDQVRAVARGVRSGASARSSISYPRSNSAIDL